MKIVRLLLFVSLLTVVSWVSAKGPPDKLTITGPGLSQPIELTNEIDLQPFAFVTFENNFENVLKTPTGLGEGYELTRYYKDRAAYVAFDHEHYYPDPQGGRGYAYYDGIINGSSEYDGRWFRVNAESEKALKAIIQQAVQPTPTPEPLPSVTLTGHTGGLTVLAWSPDSQLLITSAGWFDSGDNDARLWRADGTLVATLSAKQPIVNAAWSPDGQMLATSSWDGTVGLWSPDGTLLQTLAIEAAPFGLSWSPDGQTLAVAALKSTSDNRVELWNTADWTLSKTLTTLYSGGKFLNVGWSPDGQFLAGGAIDYNEWSADGTQIFAHHGCEFCTPAWGFAWSPDSQMWAMGNESGEVWVYDTAGDLVSQLQNNGNVDVMAWSPDGSLLAGGNSLWQFNGEAFEHRVTYASGRISSLAWSPDSNKIASSTSAPYIRVSDTSGHMLRALEGHNNAVQVLAWSPDGKTLASGSADHTVRLWDMTKLP